jgi:lipopolysaccharide/colanic/teichoic acid biosynthesis glycosyltransferase
MKSGIDYLLSDEKRRFDVAGALLISATVVPLAAVVAVSSALDTGELNPIFSQVRRGRNNEDFTIYKFRSLARHATKGEVITRGTYDNRASRFGQALRTTGLDEMPQLCNVSLGQMSLVGPRPMLDKDHATMQQANPDLYSEWREVAGRVRPGIVGPSQAHRRRHRQGTEEQAYARSMEIDLEYFERASLLTDIGILATTPLDILRARVTAVDTIAETVLRDTI